MSTYDPGKLYLIDLDGEAHQATYRYRLAWDEAFFDLTYDGAVVDAEKAQNVRPAIVLDPEDEDVKAFAERYASAASENYKVGLVAAKIAAQITPPEPPMEEPMRRFTPVTTDKGIAVRLESMLDDPWYLLDDDVHLGWHDLRNPRPYEG